MILLGSAWRHSMNMALKPNNLKFDPKSKKYKKNQKEYITKKP